MEDTTIEDVLKTVETFYDQKDYSEALKILKTNQKNISPGVWHYNVGTIYGKLENWPLARYHLIMADTEGFSPQKVTLNKDLVEVKLEVSRHEKPLTTTDYLIKGGIEASQGILTTLSLVLVVFGIVSIWKKSHAKIIIALFTAVVLVLGLNWWIQSWNKAIVLSSQLIQEGPSVIFEGREELPVGILLVGKKQGNWLKIIYPSRYQGWIKDAGLKELK
jgi:hypothetical protein